MHRQPRIQMPAVTKLEWKTIALTNSDPVVFAKELQDSLQELTDGEYIINSQMPRGDALVIVASRPQQAQQPSFKGRLKEAAVRSTHGDTITEVLYHFLDGSAEQVQVPCKDLVTALRLVKEHLQGTVIMPVNITVVSQTKFDFDGFQELLVQFAEDL